MLRPLLLFLCRRGRRRTSLVFSSASDGKLSRIVVIDELALLMYLVPVKSRWDTGLELFDHVIKILSIAMSSVIFESELFENFRYTARITSGVSYPASPYFERDGVARWLEVTANFVCDSSLAGMHLGLVVCAWRIRTFRRLNRTDFDVALSIFIQ